MEGSSITSAFARLMRVMQSDRCCYVLFLLQALASVSTIGTFDDLSDDELQARVLKDLTQWFGASEVNTWSHLRTYRIPFAQPSQV